MTDSPGDASSDDELIARLRKAETTSTHDPFFDLPIAQEIGVECDGSYRGQGQTCHAPGRRHSAVGGAYGTSATELINCELEAGHSGAHRAGFIRSRILRHWHAFEWRP